MDILVRYLLASLVVYFYAAIPFTYLIGRLFFDVDLLHEGSGNPGGSNLGRLAGTQAFIYGFIADASKGAVACLAAMYFGIIPVTMVFIALLGHSFSIFLKFRGGKGVATACGFVLVYSFWGAIFALTVFVLVLYWKKYVSLASIVAIGAYVIYSLFFQPLYYTALMLVLYLFVIYMHRENIERIKDGTERKITWM